MENVTFSMSEKEKPADQPLLVRIMAWIATIAFFALLIFIIYYAATYEPPEEAIVLFLDLVR